jgi:hypothetical protein
MRRSQQSLQGLRTDLQDQLRLPDPLLRCYPLDPPDLPGLPNQWRR